MDKTLRHVGVLGMHWGHRKGSSGRSSRSLKRKMSLENTRNIRLKSFSSKDILTGKNVVRGMLLAYGLLGTKAAIDHLMKHPIRVEVDYTRWPFKSRVPEPFFSAVIKKRVPKLLTG